MPMLKKVAVVLIPDIIYVHSAGVIEPPALYAIDLDAKRDGKTYTKLRSLFKDTWRRYQLPLLQTENPYDQISYTGPMTRDHLSVDLDMIKDDEPALFFFHKGRLLFRFDGVANAKTAIQWIQTLTPEEISDYFWKQSIDDWVAWHEKRWATADGALLVPQLKPRDLVLTADEKAEPARTATKPLLILFHKLFCEVCENLKELIEEVHQSLLEDKGDVINVATMDCSSSEAGDLCLRLGATTTPAILWFPRGIKACAASTHYCDGVEYKNAATTRALLQFVDGQSLDPALNSETALAVFSIKDLDREKRKEVHKENAAKTKRNSKSVS